MKMTECKSCHEKDKDIKDWKKIWRSASKSFEESEKLRKKQTQKFLKLLEDLKQELKEWFCTDKRCICGKHEQYLECETCDEIDKMLNKRIKLIKS